MENEKRKEFEKIFNELDKGNKEKVITIIKELKKEQKILEKKESNKI